MALNRSKRGSNDAAPVSPSVAAAFPAPAAVDEGTSRSSMMSMKRCSSAARASSAASSAIVLFLVLGDGGSWQRSGS